MILARTYAALLPELRKYALAEGMSANEADDLANTATMWARVLGLEDGVVGPEILDDAAFVNAIGRFATACLGDGLRIEDVALQAHRIRQIRAAIDTNEPSTFGARLDRAILQSRLSTNGLARLVGVTHKSVRYWRLGWCIPSRNPGDIVVRLERALQLSPGYLAESLPAGTLPASRSRVVTPYGSRQRLVRVAGYSIWNSVVEAQFGMYAASRRHDGTAEILSGEEPIRGGATKNARGRFPTEDLERKWIALYLGWASLPVNSAQALARFDAAHSRFLDLLGKSLPATADREAIMLLSGDEAIVESARRLCRTAGHGVGREHIAPAADALVIARLVATKPKRFYASVRGSNREGTLKQGWASRCSHASGWLGTLLDGATISNFSLWRGQGREESDASLAWLVDAKSLVDYLAFVSRRAGGQFHRGHVKFISQMRKMLRPHTGWLWKHSLDGAVDDETWRARCSDIREYLGRVNRSVTRVATASRTNVSISPFLDSEYPAQCLIKTGLNLLADSTRMTTPKTRSRAYRDGLLFLLLAHNPLRELQFEIMEWDRHLCKRNSTWWLRYRKDEFKNRNVLSEDYEVELSPRLAPIITKYRDEHHAVLNVGARVFGLVSIGQRIESQAFHYLGVRFGIHSARHLVATDIIKSNPEYGFVIAARALHDNLETVERHYAHLRTHEQFRPVTRFFESRYDVFADKTG